MEIAVVLPQLEPTLAQADGDLEMHLEIHRPFKAPNGASFQCQAVIIVNGRRFDKTAHGEDGLQALKLALTAADQKIKALGTELNGEPRWLDASIPPVFAELESLDRLSGSLTNLHDALTAAAEALNDASASADHRQAVARRVAPVLESAGIIDIDGVHLKNSSPSTGVATGPRRRWTSNVSRRSMRTLEPVRRPRG